MQSETSATVTVINGFIIECNDGTPSRTTYAALNTVLSGLSYPFGSGDGSTTFNVPDLRGRSPWNAGSHADCDIGDSDGVAESSRRPKHTHTSTSLTVTGSPSIGTLAVSGGPYAATPGQVANPGAGSLWIGNSTSSPSLSGSPGVGTLDVGGTAGSGMSGSDAVAHLFVGVLGVKF